MLIRCPWSETHPLLTHYHDVEWGVPKLDDREQFEHMVLEVFQAGLSWLTMLKRREGFKQAFAGFDPVAVAAFGVNDVARLLQDEGIIRNRAKIAATLNNAPLFLEVSREFGGFANFVRGFRKGVGAGHADQSTIPASTTEAETLSKELKRRGFKFVGPTICYSHLQSVGVVNDHIAACHRFAEVDRLQTEAFR